MSFDGANPTGSEHNGGSICPQCQNGQLVVSSTGFDRVADQSSRNPYVRKTQTTETLRCSSDCGYSMTRIAD